MWVRFKSVSAVLTFCFLFITLTTQVHAASPTITQLSSIAADWGTPVTITGTNFGTTQGTSTVKFNGTVATVTSWTNTIILVSVPTGSTTGNVVVTVGGIASNGLLFTVLHGNIIFGSQVGEGGTFEVHDDNGVLLQTGNLSIPRGLHTATLLTNGTIFVAGGLSDPTSWQIFSLVNSQWQPSSSGLLQDSLYSHFAARLTNGNVFLGGGEAAPGTWEIHSPTGALVGSGSLLGNRTPGSSAVALKNGNVWISGSNFGKGEDCSWEIHSSNGSLVSTGALNTCRSSGKAFLLSNGDVALFGGIDSGGDYDIYTQAGTFVRNGSLINSFVAAAGGVLVNNDVFMFQEGFWEFVGLDANGNQTFDTTGSLFDNRYSSRGVATTVGNVLLTGGNTAPGTWEIWAPSGSTATLYKTGDLFDARDGGHTDTHY